MDRWSSLCAQIKTIYPLDLIAPQDSIDIITIFFDGETAVALRASKCWPFWLFQQRLAYRQAFATALYGMFCGQNGSY